MLMRLIRLIRILRVAKLIKSNRALTAFFMACRASASQLAASLVATLLMLFIGAVLLYVAEAEVQPELGNGALQQAQPGSVEHSAPGFQSATPLAGSSGPARR